MDKKTKKWITTLENVEKLHQDFKNYRIRKNVRKNLVTYDDLRNHLLEKEDILKIAKSITNNNYYQSETLIVCKENDKLVVLDGNRRLTACQLLLKPELISNINSKKQFEELRKKIENIDFQEIEIKIAPSREAGQKEVAKNHIKTLKKNWDSFQQTEFYKDEVDSGKSFQELSNLYGEAVSEIKKKLTALSFHDLISEKLTKEQEKEELWRSGYNLIDRSILSKEAEEFLKYKIDKNIKIVCENKDEFDKKIDCLIPYFVGNKKMSAQIKKKEIKEIFEEIKKKIPGNSKSKNEEIKNTKTQISSNTSKNKINPKSTIRKNLIPKNCRWTISPTKINNIYLELKDYLIIDDSKKDVPNAVGVLFRVFLEISLNYYAKKNDKNFKKNEKIRNKIIWVTKHLIEKGCPETEFKGINKVVSADENSYLSINQFNEYVHSTIEPTPGELKSKWNRLQSFFEILWKQINDAEKKK